MRSSRSAASPVSGHLDDLEVPDVCPTNAAGSIPAHTAYHAAIRQGAQEADRRRPGAAGGLGSAIVQLCIAWSRRDRRRRW
jgi:hypothetical protein